MGAECPGWRLEEEEEHLQLGQTREYASDLFNMSRLKPYMHLTTVLRQIICWSNLMVFALYETMIPELALDVTSCSFPILHLRRILRNVSPGSRVTTSSDYLSWAESPLVCVSLVGFVFRLVEFSRSSSSVAMFNGLVTSLQTTIVEKGKVNGRKKNNRKKNNRKKCNRKK